MKLVNFLVQPVVILCAISIAVSLNIDNMLQDDVEELRVKVHENVLHLMNGDFSWSHGETSRAVIAIALGNDTFFNNDHVLSSIITKQLKLELSEALIKWSNQPLSTGRLALFINALLASCNDPYNFFDINLVLRLQNMATTSDYEKSLHSLTLCNAGEKLPKSTILHLSSYLNETKVIYGLDTKAMALMAISCAVDHFQSTYLHHVINEALLSFKSKQNPDGSFGNIYTTALVVQALIAADDNDGIRWFRQALGYIKGYYENFNEKLDLLAYFFILPIMNLKSLAHLKQHCNSLSENALLVQQLDENDLLSISFDMYDDHFVNSSKEVEDNLIAVSYGLWHLVEGSDNVSFSTVVFIKDGETLLDVMKKAAKADSNFHFQTRQYSFGTAVESIAGLANNEKEKLYWMIYMIHPSGRKLKLVSKGVDAIKPKDGDSFLLWYRKV